MRSLPSLGGSTERSWLCGRMDFPGCAEGGGAPAADPSRDHHGADKGSAFTGRKFFIGSVLSEFPLNSLSEVKFPFR